VAVLRHRRPLTAYLTAIKPSKDGSQRADWYLYDVTFRGEVVVTGSRVPECDLARALQAKGFTGYVTLLDADTSTPRMTIKIDQAAKLTVEDGARGLRFVKWKPFTTPSLARSA
jgi:hypothetical protein